MTGAPPPNARLICDISMGGSNPSELVLLGAPGNANLRHLHGLHAKVYLSDLGLITSSANASNNGIGFIEVAKLVEAGTFHAPGTEVYNQAADWFERIWNRSSQVDAAALQLAGEKWRRKASGNVNRLNRSPRPDSLLDAVAAEPQRFRGVGFAFTTGRSTREQRDETAKALIKQDEDRANPLLTDLDHALLRNWSIGDVFSEWPPQDVSAWPLRFVCAHQNGNGAISYWFYERAHAIVLEGDRGMVFGTRPGTLRSKLGFRHGREPMANADQEHLQAIFDHIGEDGHKLYESGELLAQLLADLNLLG